MQCFSINSNEIKDRFDPKYLISYKKLSDNMSSNIYYRPLSDFMVCPPQYGANESAKEWTENSKYRYIRITDIDEFGNLKPADIKTAEKIDLKYKLQENDILFARSGATAGKCFIYKTKYGKAIFAGYLIRFKIDPTKLNPDFLFYYSQTNYYKNWVNSIQRPVGQPNINSKEFCDLKIPVFSEEQEKNLEIQNNIAKIMQKAYENKYAKEREAEEVLNSTEKFILEKLEILLPEIKDKDIYTVSAKDIKHKRIDPYYFQPKFENTISMIKKSKYGSTHLNNVMNECGMAKGFSPSDSEKSGDSKVLQIKNIDTYGNIDTSYWQSSIKDIYCKTKPIQKNDIIVVVTGATIGKVAIWNKENEDFYLGGDMIKFQVSDHYSPLYVLSFLLTQLGQLQILRNITGATNGHLSPDDIKNIVICDAPQAIQGEIATEYFNNMLKAERLKREAKEEFKKAKVEVEKMILGEG